MVFFLYDDAKVLILFETAIVLLQINFGVLLPFLLLLLFVSLSFLSSSLIIYNNVMLKSRLIFIKSNQKNA